MLKAGSSWSQIQVSTGCSRATVLKIARRFKAEDKAVQLIASLRKSLIQKDEFDFSILRAVW